MFRAKCSVQMSSNRGNPNILEQKENMKYMATLFLMKTILEV